MRTFKIETDGFNVLFRVFACRASMRRAAVRMFGSYYSDIVGLFVPLEKNSGEIWLHEGGLDDGTVAHEFFHAAQHAAKDEERAAAIMDSLTTQWKKAKCKR